MSQATETKIVLTPEQKLALYKLVTGVRDDKKMQQTLGGYAGTGKTTILKYLTKFFPDYAVCAYTGKAANVLRKKGIAGQTIHSRIYKPYFDNGQVYFDLTDEPSCTGFIIDEASMVSEEIYYDLKAFGFPMIFVGDHGQLEPVGSTFNLMAKPDHRLEEIHRNAGEIAEFAQHLRNGFASKSFRGAESKVNIISKKAANIDKMLEVDQIICAFNKTRVEVNTKIRKALGYTGTINVGERVMCLRNNRNQGLFNGMQGTVAALYETKGKKMMDFLFDGEVIPSVWYDVNQFGKDSPDFKHGRDTPNPFDYAYCITAHKSQGDEWDRVMVMEQKCNNWNHKRWTYTSASRAKVILDWVLPY